MVAVTTTSAPRTAASAEGAAVTPNSLANAAACRGSDSHLIKRADEAQRFEMAACLHARAQDRQSGGIGARQVPGSDSRHRGGAHLGDQSSVQRGQRLPVSGRNLDDGVVRGLVRVVGVEGNQLRAKGLARVAGMSPRKPWCSLTETIVRTGWTTFPDEKAASAWSMAAITSSMRSKRRTAASSSNIV